VVALIAVIPDLLMACSSYLEWSVNFSCRPAAEERQNNDLPILLRYRNEGMYFI
jgi:hypothetical protein